MKFLSAYESARKPTIKTTVSPELRALILNLTAAESRFVTATSRMHEGASFHQYGEHIDAQDAFLRAATGVTDYARRWGLL